MSDKVLGSVMVVGGGIAGMQASLDLAESGFRVYMVESSPAIGGRMAQLDKTFPTNDCAMCTLAPRMVDVGGHINIEKLTYSEVVGIEGEPGHFRVRVKKKARSVDAEKCTGCGECTLKCPVLKAKSPVVLSEYDAGLVRRGSIYSPGIACRCWINIARKVYSSNIKSMSAFCNAGFDVLGGGMTSFEPYAGDITVNLVIPGLIILGGLGFLVIDELRLRLSRTQHKRLSTHTRTVLGVTAVLVIGGAALIFILESMSPKVFAPMSLNERVLTSWFQSVTARTAGFNSLRIGEMHPTSLIVIILLMFIGASPGGTGGGVKTTTFAVVAAFVWSVIIHSDQTHLGNRGVRMENVKKAVVVFALSLVLVLGGTLLLAATDGDKFSALALLFEVTSAFGTVGLSTGITPALSAGAKIVLIVTMLAGRVGVLTAMLTLLAPVQKLERRVHFAEDDVAIG
jgi:ferredoxin